MLQPHITGLRSSSLSYLVVRRDFKHVLEDFSSATAPAAEEQRTISLEDLFRTLQFASAVAGANGAGTAPAMPPG